MLFSLKGLPLGGLVVVIVKVIVVVFLITLCVCVCGLFLCVRSFVYAVCVGASVVMDVCT